MTSSVRPSPPEGNERGAVALLRPTPRFLWLMGVFILSAATVGAREVTRVGYVTDSLGSEFGIGIVAVVFALSLALSSVVAGRHMDVADPRPFLIGSLLTAGVLTATNAWFLARGPMPVGWLVISTALDAIIFGAATTALLKVQAAIVRSDARGAAETVNILRSGIGAAVGTVAAGLIGDQVTTLVISGAISVLLGVVTAAIVAPVTVPTSQKVQRRLVDLVQIVRTRPPLRRTVTVDLVLAAALPTQFIALVIVDLDAPELTTVAFTSSLMGLLLGRLALTITGVRGNLTRRLRITYLGFTTLALVAIPSLIGGWILNYPVLVAAIVFVGSALISFTQNLPAALLQQQVPDEFRGSLSGAMNAARNLLIGAAAAVLTALTYAHNAAVLTVAMVALLVTGYVVAGRFREVTASV